MALSEREQQVLRDLEEQLHVEDPSLATSMKQAQPQVGRPSPRHIGAGVALVLVGLCTVLGGVAVGQGVVSVLLGVAGFGVAVWGVTLMLTRVQASVDQDRPGSRSPRGGPSSFMERQAQRWDRRQEEGRDGRSG